MIKKEASDLLERINKDLAQKRAEVPMEALSDTMSIRDRKYFGIIFRPNNYRRQIKVRYYPSIFHKKLTPQYLHFQWKLTEKKVFYGFEYKPQITIELGTKALTAIYSQPIIGGTKEVYHIRRESLDKVQARLDEIKEGIRKRLDEALKDFISQFKLNTVDEFNPVWTRYEDWIKGEDYIDNLPKEVIIHDSVFKKVYGEGIEFIKNKGEEPTANIKNYIKNRAIEDIAPEINRELEKIYFKIDKIKGVDLEYYQLLINEASDIQDCIDKMKQNVDEIKSMKQDHKEKIEEMVFGRFKA